MNGKNRTLPVVFTLIVIMIIVSFFANIKQTEIVCEKTKKFDKNIYIHEKIISKIDGKKIDRLLITKTISFPEKLGNKEYIDSIKESLDRTLEYLEDKVKYTIEDNQIIINIDVSKNEVVLLDNISFLQDSEIRINSNTKSEEVITLTIGDNYTDGEFMQYMKSKGYSCK